MAERTAAGERDLKAEGWRVPGDEGYLEDLGGAQGGRIPDEMAILCANVADVRRTEAPGRPGPDFEVTIEGIEEFRILIRTPAEQWSTGSEHWDEPEEAARRLEAGEVPPLTEEMIQACHDVLSDPKRTAAPSMAEAADLEQAAHHDQEALLKITHGMVSPDAIVILRDTEGDPPKRAHLHSTAAIEEHAVFDSARAGKQCWIGKNARVEEGAELRDAALVHPGAKVRRNAQVHEHTIIGRDAEIGRGAKIGYRSEVMGRCRVAEDAQVGSRNRLHANTRLEGGVVTGDDVTVKADTVIEAGASLGDGCRVEARLTIGEGAVIEDGAQIRASVGPRAHICAGAEIVMPVPADKRIEAQPDRGGAAGIPDRGSGTAAGKDAAAERDTRPSR